MIFLIIILFYLNDSDGDTYFYDEHQQEFNNDRKIIDSVTPKANRAVLFDGSILHSSSKPVSFARRISLNINLVDEEELNTLLKTAHDKEIDLQRGKMFYSNH